MPDAMKVLIESRRVIEAALAEVEFSKRVTADFLNTEVEITATLADIALVSMAAGRLTRARKAAAAAKKGYETIYRFRLKLKDDDREQIESKLATLDPLIGQLAAIK